MKGFIYIAGSFETVNRSKCGRGKGWIDNDPHFWSDPPTWGICRPDLREKVDVGDYIFFVLPKNGRHPQCIFAYLKAEEKISHTDAYRRLDLRSKRMKEKKNPNGNIIVNVASQYNPFDDQHHRSNFGRIKRAYIVGSPVTAHFLTSKDIQRLAPSFLSTIRRVLGKNGRRPYDVISRYGSELSPKQIQQLIEWIATSP
jgi:hypothetical protein